MMMSDHVLYPPPILASELSCLFTALLWHGYTSECLCDSNIQPIPKGFKDPAMSANYRSIALTLCFRITGTLHSDAIYRCVLHFRFAVWVQEWLLY